MSMKMHSLNQPKPTPTAIVVVTYLSVASIFLYSILLTKTPIMFFLPAAILMTCLVIMSFQGGLHLHKTITFLLAALVFHGFIGIIAGFSTLLLLLKILSKVFLYYIAFSSILRLNNDNIRRFIDIYLKMCVVVASIGLFAVFFHIIGFQPGYDFSWFLNGWHIAYHGGMFGLPRAQSILGEPSHAGYVMGAAIFFSMGRVFGHQKSFISLRGAIVVLLFTFLTGSVTVYVTFLVAALLSFKLTIKKAITMIAIGGGIIIIIVVVVRPDFRTIQYKYEQTREIFAEEGQTKGITSSSYSLYVASLISKNTFKDSYGFGGGIGSFEYAYTRLIGEISSNIAEGHVGNYQTGSSLLNRMLTELGLFGILLLLILFYKVVTGMIRFSGDQRVMHLALSVAFVPFLVRQGTYQNHGFALFLLLFLLNYRQAMEFYKNRIKRPSAPGK